jgi:1-deoxy-D-xylulose-5-phosphate reductoisomerase
MKLSILGVTGSIGLQTLDVIRNNDEFSVLSVSCYSNLSKLREIIMEFRPKYVSIGKQEDLEVLQKEFENVEFGYGNKGLISAVTYPCNEEVLVVNGLVGSVGLEPTIYAIKSKRNVALANKETLVIGGELIIPLVKEYGVKLIPIDSEHSAIFQCMKDERKSVSSIIITASGGSFRDKTRKQLENVTVKETLNHPNWDMGAKITVDSATMMNKGLEIIEAHYLFGIDYDQIRTVLHPKSIIHSLVEFNDGSMLAHLGHPDMRVPINYAINYPNRVPYKARKLDLIEVGSLEFKELSEERYPLLRLAKEVGIKKGYGPCILNAANEAAVELFLNGIIKFLDIEKICQDTVKYFKIEEEITLENLIEVDCKVKEYVKKSYS